ncbi:MAG TPA: histidine triad nucleotide-binding protein [Clostridia bacterium]|jgi:diadenosine tetraphosphate (Ap4A) HIT family hydrolase|nr:histidine triad nucleotide-binding protein [Clostridia bacterium]
MNNCIFCKIIKGEIPSAKVYEDEKMIIIKDLNPQAKIHLLMIPKSHYSNIIDMTEKQAIELGLCLKKIGEISDSLGLRDGFRIISNKGLNGRQSINHLHFHIMGGEQLTDKMG